MVRSSIFAKGLLVAASVMSLAAVAAPAAAQPMAGGPGYDPCAREANGRGIAGGLIGGGLGAAVGANAAARGNRQDGALLGGALGAIAGAVIGNKSAACGSGNGYYDYDRAPPPPPVAPAPAASYGGSYYADRSYYNPYGRAYRRGFERRDVVIEDGPPAVGADGCTLAESPIYLPDGRVQKRFVRVCQDANGRYQVVD